VEALRRTCLFTVCLLAPLIQVPALALAETAAGPVTSEITLVTGDRVVVRGKAVTPAPARGREAIAFHTYEVSGHRYIIPADAAAAVASGKLDRRLFDVTALQEFGYANTSGIPLIVAGQDRFGGTVSMTVPKGQGWPAIKASPDKVWLDGKRKLSLAESVPQIGAPTAWKAGFTGKGVTVAVLDTGIDATHPDFAGRIADNQNFTAEKDLDDKNGHGTHVASTIAGSGAASNGKYRGVAPDASLVIGKVCADDGCPESAILKGMEWAARDKKAQVINISLGGPNSEEIDPLEAAIDKLTAETGALFVVAAGNDGVRPESVNSPSTADAALSVGAVGKKDDDAFYSSHGPRFQDGAIKPEIAAPGSGIVAAKAKNADLEPIDKSYTMSSGTSMATPHVTGAAALLAQQRPGWRAAELKSTLVSSAEPVKLDVNVIGAGRVDVARAIKQDVFATTNTLNLGLQRWPHDDDKPVSGTVTYRNTGSAPVTLTLAVAGQYTADQQVTVPAGGQASAKVTADTRTGPDGYLTGRLIATAGDTRIVTPLTVHKEVESYDLRLTQIGRDGKPAPIDSMLVLGMDTVKANFPYDLDGTLTLRRPKDRYIVDSHIVAKDSYTHIIHPTVTLDRDTELVLDARAAKLMRPTVPNSAVGVALMDAGLVRYFDTPNGRTGMISSAVLYAGPPFYSLHAGPALPEADLQAWMAFKLAEPGPDKDFVKSPTMYNMLWSTRGTYPTGFEPHVPASEFAEVRQHYHATPAGKFAETWTLGTLEGLGHTAAGGPLGVRLPFQRTEYFQAGRTWSQSLALYKDPAKPEISNLYARDEALKPGTSQVRHWNRAVFTPAFESVDAPSHYRSARNGASMNIFAAPYVDSTPGRTGFPMDVKKTGRIALYRDGKLVASHPDLFYGQFDELPAEEATYRAEMSLQLDEAVLPLSSKTSTAWTFRSAATSELQALPLMNVRISPNLDSNNAVRPNQLLVIPVTVQRNPGSVPAKITDVTIEGSFDDGATWHDVPVFAGNDIYYGLEANDTSGDYTSVRVTATDDAGGKVEQTVVHAYRVTRTSSGQ
jgi:subtilisin family serine protease